MKTILSLVTSHRRESLSRDVAQSDNWRIERWWVVGLGPILLMVVIVIVSQKHSFEPKTVLLYAQFTNSA